MRYLSYMMRNFLEQCNEIYVIYLCATSWDSVMRYLSYMMRHFLGQCNEISVIYVAPLFGTVDVV